MSMSAVMMLPVARSLTAVVKAGYSGWSTRLAGKGLGIMVTAFAVSRDVQSGLELHTHQGRPRSVGNRRWTRQGLDMSETLWMENVPRLPPSNRTSPLLPRYPLMDRPPALSSRTSPTAIYTHPSPFGADASRE